MADCHPFLFDRVESFKGIFLRETAHFVLCEWSSYLARFGGYNAF